MDGLVRHALDAPERRIANDAACVREVIDASGGCDLFSLRLLRSVTGLSAERSTGASEEILFVLSGRGRLLHAAEERELEPETGVLLGAGTRYELDNDGPADLVIVSVSLHDPAPRGGERAPAVALSLLADQAAQSATAAREFRVVFDAENGCPAATAFVGYIPVGAAPEHYHLYDEVIYLLEGDGVIHMDASQTPLHAGTCIHLPARKLHTLANSGPGTMRVFGVFRPAGSPAAAFYPDGTPAQYAAGEPQPVALSS